jgi:DNA alkylation damage repair protein AlkB
MVEERNASNARVQRSLLASLLRISMHSPSTSFRAIERVFRRGNGVLTESCASAKGALDFHSNPPSNAPSYPPLKIPTPKLAAPRNPLGASCTMYGLLSHPGFYILPGALSPTYQLSLFRACLRYYMESPQRSVKGTFGEEGVSLWQSSVRQGIEVPSPLHTLAWATLGVHFDWKARCYPTRGSGSGGGPPFPPVLGGILQELAESIEGRVEGAAHAPSERSPLHPFSPHSAIVSLYHPSRSKERLPIAGHRDDAPGEDLSTPVVSISLGATAVFLLGGKTKECSPTPLLLRSGDVMVLSGQSRACVHGVPRVLFPTSASDAREGAQGRGWDAAVHTRDDTSTNHLFLPQMGDLRNGEGREEEEEEEEERRAYFPGGNEEERAFLHFLSQARINITARSIVNHS